MRPVVAVDDPAFGISSPPGLLDDYRVDLFQLLRQGIPEPQYVPGCDGFVRAGKRHLAPAPAGTGKSLAWQRIAIGVVQNGGSAVILDVENGADEYARRLQCILDCCDELSQNRKQGCAITSGRVSALNGTQSNGWTQSVTPT